MKEETMERLVYEKEISENIFWHSEIPISDLLTLKMGEPRYKIGDSVFAGNCRDVVKGKVKALRYKYEGSLEQGVGRWQYLVANTWYGSARIDKSRKYIESCL